MNKQLLKEVKKRREKRNVLTIDDYKLSMSNYILKIYDVCTPNKYGEAFPYKLQYDVGPSLKNLPRIMERGDLHIGYKKFLEAKISYLTMSGGYCINNIRDWQNIDYYILCFVDSKFKATFYCVPGNVIINNPKIKLTGMNNSQKINSFNTYVGKKASIKSDDVDTLFKKSNLLNGTTYKDLTTFIKSLILTNKTK